MSKPDIFGILVGDIRASIGINQNELAAGLFRRDKLKKYESGEIELDKLEVDALLQRLGKAADKYFIVLDSGEYRLAIMRTWIQVYLRRGKLLQAEYAIKKYEIEHGANAPLHRQFLYLMKAELLRRQKAPFSKQKEIILSGLFETIDRHEFSSKIVEHNRLHLMELFLIERYAAVLEEEGDKQSAVLWYKGLIKRFEHERRDIADRQKLYPFAAYRLANYYFEQLQFDEALALVHKARKLLEYSLISNTLFVMLGQLEIDIKKKAGYFISEKEQTYICRLGEVVGQYKEKWRENYYPMYLESYLCCVNDLIRERRIVRGIKREELADGVCDARTLERIEKGQARVQKRVKQGLLKKLGLSELKYDGGIVTNTYDDYKQYEKMANLCDQYEKESLDEAWLIYQELLQKASPQYLTNQQFREYWEVVLKFRKKEISQKERNRRLWAMLDWTLPIKRENKVFSGWLTAYEKMAIGEIAWDCEEDEMKKLMPLLKEQYKRYKGMAEQVIETGTYGQVVYCLIRGYLKQGNFQRAEKYFKLRLAQTCFEDRGMWWSRLLFLRFQIEEKKRGLWEKENPLESDADAFQWAKMAWAVTKSTHEKVICHFIETYFQRHYFISAEYLD